jgi:hypothetical protein
MMGHDFRSVLTGGATSQTSLAFYHSDRCISWDELGYFQPLSMADPRLGIQPLCDSTALITMADPTVADSPQMYQETWRMTAGCTPITSTLPTGQPSTQ